MRDTELDTLRKDAALHNLDTGRARISEVIEDEFQGYVVNFPAPVVALGPWSEGVPTGTVRCRTADHAEELMLAGMLRLVVAERRRVRLGAVCGWSSDRIARCPLSDDEIAAYRARIGHADKVRQLQSELAEALAAQSQREAAERGADQLAQRYGMSAAAVQSTSEHPTLLSGKRRPRASRKTEVNSHE